MTLGARGQETPRAAAGRRHDRCVTDDPRPDGAQPAPDSNQAQAASGRSADPRYAQRNLANRLFPGPSRIPSRQLTDHIDRLLRPLDSSTPPAARPGRPARTRASGDGSRSTRTADTSASPGTPEDAAQVRDMLEQQNELLRAILANSVDAQEDARSTAQNSRTFAWAGTAIALLTFLATVVSIVAAVMAH
jgi:hypothetical protein